jgi:glutamate racemase
MRKIGVLDSGLGGFSLLKDLLNHSLDAEYFFISDNNNVPYGGKSQSFMLSRISLMVDSLLKQKVEAIIIACNTATTETISALRERYSIPFIGIEPYINYLNHSPNEKMALILTPATFSSNKFKDLSLRFDPYNLVKVYPLSNLAIIIERLFSSDFSEVEAEIIEELSVINFNEIDSLILGCTHYPLIKRFLTENYNIKTIDPNLFVIKQLINVLNLKPTNKNSSTFSYSRNISEWTSVDLKEFDIFY